ncbi:phosphodiesterase [Picosynechococcus sp. PCC 7003]|uniref:phosphodiesterase n=1 Tax=Picosynechococcus sp. PCC 7003 TaxID=374981 RepID=UPI0008107B71|nr:phosphodiesterase [Picosynechococcus sp. PCC 7003]ANV83491.1 phosphodiesterase [Picosynechococcus sp. PCC 7003]
MVLIAQITDTHLLDHPDAEMRGVKTDASFQAVLAAAQQFKPDRVILTGDLAHHGEAIAYKRLRDLVEATQIPSYWLPGNHDDPKVMAEILQGDYLSPEKSVSLGPWQLLLLDSFLKNPEYGEGFLDANQLAWLAENLEQYQNSPVAIAIHHHVVPAGVDWLDQIDVTNRAEFWEIIQNHPQVKTVFFGHVHLEYSVTQGEIPCFGTPSTCTQVTPPDQEPIAGDRQLWEQPGFRLFELQDDGHFATTVQRIPWFT